METEFGYFDFFTGCCFVSPDQDDILENCPTLGELEVLYEEEPLLQQLSGGQAEGSTGVFMASPVGSTQVARNESITPRETYHTPPEEAVPRSSSSVEEAVFANRGYRDGERVVDLGRDDDLGIPETTERAVQQLLGADQRFETGNARGLKRGPSSDDRPSKKPGLSGGNEGLRGSPAERTQMMQVKLCVETQDKYAGMFEGKLKGSLEKAVESLKVYGPVVRGVRIHGENLTERKPNSTVKLEDAPTVVDLKVEETENVPVPRSSTDKGEADAPIVVDLEVEETGNVAVPGSSTVKGEADAPIVVDLEVEETGNVPVPGSSTDKREADAPIVIDLEVEESENVPVPGSSTDKGEADRLIGTGTAQMARSRAEVRNAAHIPNFTYEGGKDLPFRDKGKEVAQHHTIGIRDREKLKSRTGDDRRGERSSEINVTAENVQRLECDTGPNGAEMDCVRGAESVEKIENLEHSSGKDNKSGESSDIDENLQTLPVCVHELAQHALGRVKASSGRLKGNAHAIINFLEKLAEGCEGQELEEGSIMDFAEKRGITFPRPPSRKSKALDP